MNVRTYVFPGYWKNGMMNQANIHKVLDYLRSWRNKHIITLLSPACS
jgi:hypothetical protein